MAAYFGTSFLVVNSHLEAVRNAILSLRICQNQVSRELALISRHSRIFNYASGKRLRKLVAILGDQQVLRLRIVVPAVHSCPIFRPCKFAPPFIIYQRASKNNHPAIVVATVDQPVRRSPSLSIQSFAPRYYTRKTHTQHIAPKIRPRWCTPSRKRPSASATR